MTIQILEPRPGKRIAVVEVPDNRIDYQLRDNDTVISFGFENGISREYHQLPAKCRILGLSTDLTEEQCRAIMPEPMVRHRDGVLGFMVDVMDTEIYSSALLAFASFMVANGFVDRKNCTNLVGAA